MENAKPKKLFTTPLIMLCVFLVIAQLINGLYFYRGVAPSNAFSLLYSVCFFLLIGWWLKEDNKTYRIKWVYDIGFFLYLAWMFIIPYYLFKTRGIKGFITILSFVGLLLGTYLIGVIVAMLLSLQFIRGR